jgi:CelD/BcsL family acetyltransferase involved in cellulose biosynthesis
MIEISKIESMDELLKIENEWNELAEKSNPDNVFISFDWVLNWWKYFGLNNKMFIMLAKKDERIIGIAPLMLSPTKMLGVSLKKLEFIGMPLSDYCDFIIEPDVLEDETNFILKEFYDYILQKSILWSFVKLNRLSDSSQTLEISKQVLSSRKLRMYSVMQTDICPSYFFDDEWKEFRESINSRTTRKRLNQLRNMGNLDFLTLESEVDSEKNLQLLNLFFEQHKKRWDNSSTPSMFTDENYKTFFISVFMSLLDKKKADLYCLKLNDTPVAFQFAFLGKVKFMAYISSYDCSYAKNSPGIVMHKFVMEHCASRKYKEFDMMRGNEKYKLDFANKIKKNYAISIHKNTFLYVLDKFSSSMENKIKNNKILYDFFIRYEKKLRCF